MNLKFVTWDGDLTQFLVNAETDDKAIKLAMKANFEYEKYDDHMVEDMEDPSTYKVEDIDTMEYLFNIIQRNDWISINSDVIVFND